MVRLEQTEARINRLRQLVKNAASAPAPQAAPDRSTEITALTAEVARLTGELEEARARLQELEEKNMALAEDNHTLESEVRGWREGAAQNTKVAPEDRGTVAKLQQDNLDLKWGNTQLKNRVDTLAGENAGLKAKLKVAPAASGAPADLLTQIGELTTQNVDLTERLAKAAAPSPAASPADPGILSAKDNAIETQASQIRDLEHRLEEALKFADEIDELAGAAVHKLLANIQSKLPHYAEMQAAHDQRRSEDPALPPFDLFEAVMSDSDIDPNLREPLREILARGKGSSILEL